MNWLSSAPVVLGSGVVLAGAVFAVSKFFGVRGRIVAEHRRVWYVDLLGRMVLAREGIPRMLRRRGADPVFREVLLQYLRFLEGRERNYLLVVAQTLGLVDQYTRELRHSHKEVRVRAAEALTEIAEPSTVQDLVMALTDPIPEVRIQAAAALARIRDHRSARAVLIQLDHEDEWAANRIGDALVRFGSGAVEAMTEYLEGPGHYVPLVVRSLGLIGDTRAEPILDRLLDNENEEVRMRAAAALGKAGSPLSLLDLAQALRDPAWEVRAQAARALGELMDGQAVTWLRHALTDRSWWVRNNAAASLANLPGGAEALRDALDDWDPYARDVAAAMLLSSGLARRAIARLEADDPIEREQARSLIRKLVEAGNEEYFRLDGTLEIVQRPETRLD
jgi:HEAT repeat protein